MSIISKWDEIIMWVKANGETKSDPAEPIRKVYIDQIETLLGEPVPYEFYQLYAIADGQKEGEGLFFGHQFMNAEEIIAQLQFSRTLLKPTSPSIEDPKKSQALIEKIVAYYKKQAPPPNIFGLKKSWFKMEFSCAPNAFGGPYLYRSEKKPNQTEIVYIKNYRPIDNIVAELHELEKHSYNWDELHFVVFANGTYEVKRAHYNFDEQIPFTSTPENAIKKKYFHYKWLPVFSDYSGNYIGIDLDPAPEGKKGQVINFGRDEEDMFVISENLEGFFDLIVSEITTNNGLAFKTGYHLLETIREIKGL